MSNTKTCGSVHGACLLLTTCSLSPYQLVEAMSGEFTSSDNETFVKLKGMIVIKSIILACLAEQTMEPTVKSLEIAKRTHSIQTQYI